MYYKSAIIFVFMLNDWISLAICCSDAQSEPGNFNAVDDAKAILEAPDRNKAFLDILPNRNLEQCAEINIEFAKLNNHIPLTSEQFVLQNKYKEGTLPDLLYALIYGPRRTKTGYINSVLYQEYGAFSTEIPTEILILSEKNKTSLIEDYNFYYPLPIHDTIDHYDLPMGDDIDDKGDYRNFLHEMVNRIREENYNGPCVEEDEIVRRLNDERTKDAGWQDNRKELDFLLMQKPAPFVLEVIKKYADSNHGNQLRDDIMKKLDDDYLKFGYPSLIDYVTDPNKYMANRIHDSATEAFDYDATLILIIVCYSENGLYDVDQAFQKEYNGQTIKSFLLEGDNPGITRQILAAIADKKSQEGGTNACCSTVPPVKSTELIPPPSPPPLP